MNSKNQSPAPPRWAKQFLCWFCADHLIEGILGDLLEQFEEDVAKKGVRRARRLFVWRVIRVIHPITMSRSFLRQQTSSIGLYGNHVKVAFRSMKKYKFYAGINLIGLALAVAFVFISYLYIQHERSFDQFHGKKDRTYRIYQYSIDNETQKLVDGSKNGCTPIPLLPDLASGVSSIENSTRFGSTSATIVHNQIPYEEIIAMADADFFEMFDFPIINGHKSAFKNPNVVFLSEQKALKYFGEENPVGQSLELILGDSSLNFQVAGVVNNKQSQTSLNFDFLIPFEQMKLVTSESSFRSYKISFIESYVTLDVSPKSDLGGVFTKVLGNKMDGHTTKRRIGLQPITDIHFDKDIQGMYPAAGSERLWLLGGLALLVLVVAVINFVTLSVGHSMHRIREVGLRRIFGAGGVNLKTQLILETLLISSIATVFAVLLVLYFLPLFNAFVEAGLDYRFMLSRLGFMVLVIIGISVITGGVQSLVLTGYSPFKALRGGTSPIRKKSINNAVIIFQFAVAVLLIFGTLVIHKQMAFIQSKDLGFNKNQLIEIELHTSEDINATRQAIKLFESEIEKNPIIIGSSAAMNSFRDPWTRLGFRQADQSHLQLYFNLVDKDYIETMNMEIVQGSSFSNEDTSLPTDIIVNETLVKTLNWQNPIGKQIPGQNFEVQHRVVGVVRDFHFGSLHQKIQPLLLVNDPRSVESGITGLSTYVWPPNYYTMAIRLVEGDLLDQIAFLEDIWRKVNPNKAFTFNFVDDLLAAKYAEELRWRKLAKVASIFALSIAWLGLLGLTRLSVQRRIKEIGIRKVLGSTVFGITQQLSQTYVVLVVLACLMVLPFGWWAMQEWLASFNYRIVLNPLTYVVASFTVLVITFCSVAIQGYKAALTNPVDVLRME